MKKIIALGIALTLAGCISLNPPEWTPVTSEREKEYQPYFEKGKETLSGQAFMVQMGGNAVKAAGMEVTLDPATSIGNEWWGKSGRQWAWRNATPPSQAFQKARRTTIADAEGRFKFANLPTGKYHVRSAVTWFAGDVVQGGLVGRTVEIESGVPMEVVLNRFYE